MIQAGIWLPDKLSLSDVVRRKLKRKAASMAGGGKAIAAA